MILSFAWGMFIGAFLGFIIAAIIAIAEDNDDGE